MVGPPTIWRSSEEHLGRRKSEGALAVANARLREEEWRALARALRERLSALGGTQGWLEKSGTNVPIGTFVPGFFADPSLPASVAFVEAHLAARARAIALPSHDRGAAGSPRLCTSLGPDAARASLAALGDLGRATAWVCAADSSRERLARGLGFAHVERLPADRADSLFSPAALALAALRGAHLPSLIAAALSELSALETAPLEENEAFRLGALLSGFPARGAHNLGVAAPPEWQALAAAIESAAAALPEKTRFTIAGGEALDLPYAYGADRWFIHYRSSGVAAPRSEQSARARRLIGAGVPLIQLALPEASGLARECVRWELALGFAAGRAGEREATAPYELEAGAELPFELALREGALSIYAGTPAHAYILRKVSGTLGKEAEQSVPAWLAAQAALGESGDYVSLHWLGLPTRAARETLANLQHTMSGPNRLAVRTSFALPEFDGAQPLAGASPRGLFFILSDGGGAELLGLRKTALGAEQRALAALANAGRRAILLRAEDGDDSKLVAALKAAGALLTP